MARFKRAVCGHDIPPMPGRQRLNCEDCKPGQDWGRHGGAERIAACGHPAPKSQGLQRKWCSSCDPRNASRACAECGADITGRRMNAKYCSTECGEMARGERRPQPLPERTCAVPECGAPFTPFHDYQRCCSEKHGKLLYNRESRADGRQKAPKWDDRRREHYHRRRALLKGATTGEPVILSEIAERDGFRCGICAKRVDMDLEWPHPKSPSQDHIVPLTKGGAHDPSNVQLAHLGCNSSKGDRAANDQLRLIG